MRNFIARTQPKVPSQISECLGAGTGCRWCVPFLEKLHRQWVAGEPLDLPVSPQSYANRRAEYRRSGRREDPAADERSEGGDGARGAKDAGGAGAGA